MKFTVDRSRWRCGSFTTAHYGEGPTQLLNTEGYQCCLGQVSEQLGFSKEDLLNRSTPRHLCKENILCERTNSSEYENSQLAHDAMTINDNFFKLKEDREDALKQVFSKNGHEIVFINEYSSVREEL